MQRLKEQAQKAKSASYILANLSADVKNKALLNMAKAIENNAQAIIAENKKDILGNKSLNRALVDRLSLGQKRIKQMADSLRQVANLTDPVGDVIDGWTRPNGLWIQKVRVPIGVIAVIYESRPNVTCDCAGLCLKSGNACVLRGGKEAIHTNRIISSVMAQAAIKQGIPEGAITFIDTPDRKAINFILKMKEQIDLVIPRGGEGLINFVTRNSMVPIIKHYKGICHVYVDDAADLKMAENICFNAKVQRPGVCNAMETLLVHRACAGRFLPVMVKKYQEAGVEIRGCEVTRKIVKGVKSATEKDWRTEYLDLILSVRVVENINEAVGHINTYGSHHSDAIVSESYSNADIFLKNVDSACVYVNASTRFTDGYEFGMGAEIGISTDKIHARGPMALEELTSYKYMIFGSGQIRA